MYNFNLRNIKPLMPKDCSSTASLNMELSTNNKRLKTPAVVR
jgi:hypothetical protein